MNDRSQVVGANASVVVADVFGWADVHVDCREVSRVYFWLRKLESRVAVVVTTTGLKGASLNRFSSLPWM